MEDIQKKKKMTDDEKLEAEAVSIQSNLYIKDTQGNLKMCPLYAG
jgi:hypothetical protein